MRPQRSTDSDLYRFLAFFGAAFLAGLARRFGAGLLLGLPGLGAALATAALAGFVFAAGFAAGGGVPPTGGGATPFPFPFTPPPFLPPPPPIRTPPPPLSPPPP